MKYNNWFIFTVIFLLIDYARPQDIVPLFGLIRPAMLTTIVLLFFIAKNFHYIRTLQSKQLTLIWYFILLTAVLIPFARNNFHAYKTTITMMLFMPFILSVIANSNSTKELKKIFFFVILFMVFQAQNAVFHAGRGTGGQFFDENDLSLFVNTWLPFCYVFMMSEKKITMKLFYAATLVLGIGATVVSFSRGGFLGMIAMFFVFWLTSSKKVVTLICVIIVMGVGSFFVGEKYKDEMKTSTNSSSGTGRERIESWKAGWNMFLHNPLGVGGNNYQVRFPEYQSDYFKRGMWGRVAHSLWFTLIPELGLVGIFIYFKIVYLNVRDVFLFKKYSKQLCTEDGKFFMNLSTAFMASFAGFFISATFISVLYYSHFWFLTAFVIATRRVVASIPPSRSVSSN